MNTRSFCRETARLSTCSEKLLSATEFIGRAAQKGCTIARFAASFKMSTIFGITMWLTTKFLLRRLLYLTRLSGLGHACKRLRSCSESEDISIFNMSEPEFLIGVMDRHQDWCVIVCLVGGGQEINTGEAGISEWISALEVRFPNWEVHVSPRISLPEYGSRVDVSSFLKSPRVHSDENLHLAVSMRSFRAEDVSRLVGHIVDNEPQAAHAIHRRIKEVYPIFMTRDLKVARAWLRNKARGTERFGLVASSGAQRLRPEGIHVRADIEAVNWLLNDRTDVRSSFYPEDVANEFAVQGLELDWTGVCWDGDFHHNGSKWMYQSFKGTRWQFMKDESKRLYLKNAYRVILTRARQGIVIFVPEGDTSDGTRPAAFYDGTFEYLRSCGIPTLQ